MVIFGDAGFDFADEIATDVSAFGEDAAAETGKDRDQRGAKAECDEGVDDSARCWRVSHAEPTAGQGHVINGAADEREARDQHAGDGAGTEGHVEPA